MLRCNIIYENCWRYHFANPHLAKRDCLSHIRVSEYHDKALSFSTLPKSALTNLIASSMTARESFACYRDGDGNMIALDKTGFCVTE